MNFFLQNVYDLLVMWLLLFVCGCFVDVLVVECPALNLFYSTILCLCVKNREYAKRSYFDFFISLFLLINKEKKYGKKGEERHKYRLDILFYKQISKFLISYVKQYQLYHFFQLGVLILSLLSVYIYKLSKLQRD